MPEYKSKENKEYKNVLIRLSPDEKKIVEELKGDLKLQTFCKKAILNKKVVKTDDTKALLTELSKIGTNINQIAKIANQTKEISQEQFTQLLILQRDGWKIVNKFMEEMRKKLE